MNSRNNNFTPNTLFLTPSADANFILGYSASGSRGWKNNNSKSLKEINEE